MRILLATAVLLAGFVSAAAANPIGTWLARNGKANVTVTNCDAGLCANIVSLQQPHDSNGRPLTDKNNPDGRLKNRPIIGLPLFLGMRATGRNTWEGQVYDPEKGGIFRGFVQQISGNILKVQGCLSMGFPCETYMWKRIK